jgi:rubrerythrin
MSIVYTLKKLVDPAAAREEEAQLKKAREEVRQQQSGAPPDPGAEPEAEATRWRCRCCGVEDKQGGYCPECLADTMEVRGASIDD